MTDSPFVWKAYSKTIAWQWAVPPASCFWAVNLQRFTQSHRHTQYIHMCSHNGWKLPTFQENNLRITFTHTILSHMWLPTSCCSFSLSPSKALLASSRASPKRAFLSLSAAPSLSAFTSPCSLCTSESRILMVRASSTSCCRTRASRTAAVSRSFSSCSLARRSVIATACLCCSSSRACRCSWRRSRSLHTWKTFCH